MTDEERDRALEAAWTAPQSDTTEYLEELRARIQAFESRYELPTSQLSEELVQGRIRETAEVCEWLYLAQLRDRLGQARS